MEQIFDICPSFCVTWLQTWNRVTLIQFANAFAIAITFARWRRRRSEATTIPYGANFFSFRPHHEVDQKPCQDDNSLCDTRLYNCNVLM